MSVEGPVFRVVEGQGVEEASQDGEVGGVCSGGWVVLVLEALEESSEYWIVDCGSDNVLSWIASTHVGDPLAHRLERVCDCITSDRVLGAVSHAKDEEVAQLVFATRDVREVGWVAEFLAEELPSSDVGGVGFACLPGVGCGGDLESSAEVKIEACLDGR